MNIIALDGHPLNPGDNSWEPLARLGNLTVHPRTSPDDLIARAREAEILVTNKVELRARHFAALPRLKFIAVSATGYNIVDTDAARERGIPVANVPAYSSDAVAQHTFALLLDWASRVALHNAAVQAGEWSACPDFSFTRAPLTELAGQTIGVIGFGEIGRRVGKIAHAFGMNVLACARRRHNPPEYQPFAWADLRELCRRADVVSLHCPQTPETAGMIDREMLSLMKPGAFLVNTARGGLIVEEDLAEALNAGHLAGAALDVVAEEPIRPDNPLLGARNCLITPHIAWATVAARKRLMERVAENVAAFLRGAPVNVVNQP